MARSISAAALAKLTQQYGAEPINILEVAWVQGNTPLAYADRDVANINGRILEVSNLDNVIDISGSNNSQEITVKLDDTDGTIKAIFDQYDVHQRDVTLYQFFDGLDPNTDKFVLFTGKISSPVSWDERDRTFSFTVISQLEDKEIGFSAEEGQFPFVPNELVGKPWPLIFGKCFDVPALQINKAVSGETLCGVGIISGGDLHNQVPIGGENPNYDASLAMTQIQLSHLSLVSSAGFLTPNPQAEKITDAAREQANELRKQIAESHAERERQRICAEFQRSNTLSDATSKGLGCNPVRILGGEDFPQNTTITLKIGGGFFTGVMQGDNFYISFRSHPENETKAQEAFNAALGQDEQGLPLGPDCGPKPPPAQFFDFQTRVPGLLFGTDPNDPDLIQTKGFIVSLNTFAFRSRPSVTQVAQHFWADSGSRATIASDEPIHYIVSITPGTVLAVKAFKSINGGERRLVNVPTSLWTQQTVNYGPVTAEQLVLSKPLTSLEDQGWESDDIYVTFNSSVGPNTVDILEYLIINYTDLTFDTPSFNAVKAKLGPFPSNFPILDRKNTIQVLQEIAFQARCAIWLNNGVFYLKYLPEEPTPDETITFDDIDVGSLVIDLTPTEDIVTKMNLEWRISYAAENPHKMILRHNVKKYGTKEQDYFWYIYNQPDIIIKAATFWLIRLSHTWKKVKFRTSIDKLRLETFDSITLSLSEPLVSGNDITAVVEKADFNSEDLTMDFEVWTPVQAGSLDDDPFFWPADLSQSDFFPTAEDIASGFAGGDGIGAGASGALPIGFSGSVTLGNVVFVGGPNVVFGPQSDRGDKRPTDAGFSAQPLIDTSVYANVSSDANPQPFLGMNYADPPTPIDRPELPANGVVISLQNTYVRDEDQSNPNALARLNTFFERVNDDRELVMKTTAKLSDGDEAKEKEFDFKFDDEDEKWGAGTAFLKDDQ